MVKKILTSEKLLFNFTKNTSNETIIYSLGQLARKDFYTGFKKYSFNQLNDLLKIEKNIQKISPNLIQKLPRLKENQANKILSQFGLNINQVTKISTDEWYSVMNKLYKKGLGKNLILYVNSVRTTKIFNNKVINFLGNTSQKINKLLNYVNPNFYIKKATKKLFAPLEKRIVAIKQKIISQVHNKLQKLYSKFEIKAIQKGQLLPFAFGSDVFLAVRIEPLSIVGEVVLTIYYKNPNYEPIVIMTTAVKAEKFVLAKEPFVYYMHSEWFIGWGTETGGLFNLVPLAPEPIRKIVFDSFKIYRTIAKVLKFKEQIKTNFNKDRFKKSFEESVFQSLLGGGLLFQSYKLIREKRSFKKYAKKKGISNSKKYITNKIYSKKNKW